jgi:hypothetical protein
MHWRILVAAGIQTALQVSLEQAVHVGDANIDRATKCTIPRVLDN